MDFSCDSRFAYNSPTVADVKPSFSSILGGDEINIGGLNLGVYNRHVKEVRIKGVVCNHVKVLSPELIQCISGRSLIAGAGLGVVEVILTNGLASPQNMCNLFEYKKLIEEKITKENEVKKDDNNNFKLPPAPVKKKPCLFKNGKLCCNCLSKPPIAGVKYKNAVIVPVISKNYYDTSYTRKIDDASQLLFDIPKVGLRKNRFKTDLEEELSDENEKIYKHIIETETNKKRDLIILNNNNNLR